MIYLTAANMRRFIGGQFKVQYPTFVYCGQIKELTLSGNTLKVEFTWMAKADGFVGVFPMRRVRRWVDGDGIFEFNVEDLRRFDAAFIGEGRIRLQSHRTEEYLFLCPPSAPLLNPTNVSGLRRSG